jgi:hypothetical protein
MFCNAGMLPKGVVLKNMFKIKYLVSQIAFSLFCELAKFGHLVTWEMT